MAVPNLKMSQNGHFVSAAALFLSRLGGMVLKLELITIGKISVLGEEEKNRFVIALDLINA